MRFFHAIRAAVILAIMGMTCVHAQHRRGGFFGGIFHRSQPACQQVCQPQMGQVQVASYQRTSLLPKA